MVNKLSTYRVVNGDIIIKANEVCLDNTGKVYCFYVWCDGQSEMVGSVPADYIWYKVLEEFHAYDDTK